MKPFTHFKHKKSVILGISFVMASIIVYQNRGHQNESPRENSKPLRAPQASSRNQNPIAPSNHVNHEAIHQASPSPVSQQFHLLQSKVLKTERELAQFHSDLESPEQMSLALNQLTQIPNESVSNLDAVHQNREQRMAAIDWIEEALSWKDNPRRSEILEQITHLVSRDVSSLPVALEVKHTLAGDKIELIGLLASSDPHLASKLEEAARGSKDIKLFQYAKTMYGIQF